MRKPSSPGTRQPLKTFLIAAAAFGIGLLLLESDLLMPLDRALLDAQTQWLQREVETDAALVEIDARSLKEFGTWPWPRRRHAEIVEALVAGGAERIVIDIDFSTSSLPQEDARLAEAIGSAGGRVFLPAFWQPTSATADSMILSEPIAGIREHVQLGSVNLAPAADGRVREVFNLSPPGASIANLPLAQVLNPGRWGGAPVRLIDYRISPRSFPTLSVSQLLADPDAAEAFRGRTVFVGATALEMGDLVTVPVHGSLPGVLVQALAYETVRAHEFRETSRLASILALLVTAAAATLLAAYVRWQRLPALGLSGVILVMIVASVGFVAADVWWMAMPPATVVVVAVLGTLTSRLQLESVRALAFRLSFRRQDALLREIVGQSTDAILTLDDSGVVSTANPAAAKLFGMGERRLLGQPIASLVPEASLLLANLDAEAVSLELVLSRPDRAELPVELAIAAIAVDGERIITVKLRDISLQKNRELELRHHATHDDLTGLPNRVYLHERLSAVLGDRRAGREGVLVLLDLDGFKEVNDALGHSVGDVVLTEVGRRLGAQIPSGGFVARLGGDEFALLLECNGDSGVLEAFCEGLLLSAREPIHVRGVPISLGFSAGIARWPLHSDLSETLLQKADVALYTAKRRRSGFEFYDPAEDNNTPRRLEMLTLLRGAIRKNELHLVFQPKIDFVTGQVNSVEALCRWASPELGAVSPGEFMPLAEASEIITPLTRWTLERALLDCRIWREAGHAFGVAVNLSARHLQDSRLPQLVAELLGASGLSADALELEITESAIMTDPDRAYGILSALRGLGVKLSIDDFGTGYSSLAYLHRLQVDRLKIDKSFIDGMLNTEGSRVIVSSTIQLGHALGLQVIAEGIETREQHETLRQMGCDFGQGYFYSRGIGRDALMGWLAEREAAPQTTMARIVRPLAAAQV